MIVKLLTEHHLEFLRLTGGCKGSSESTHVKMPHCWESHAMAQIKLLSQLKKKSHECSPGDLQKTAGTNLVTQ